MLSSQTATTVAVAEQGQKMTLQASDLRKLHDVADEAIRSINLRFNEMTAHSKEKKEQTWHLARPKDLLPTTFTDEKEWRKWKETSC